jgi:hypothetical protein
MSLRPPLALAVILACGVPAAAAQTPIDSTAVVAGIVQWFRLDPATGAAGRVECAAFMAGEGSTHQALTEDSAGYALQIQKCQRVAAGQTATSWRWFVVPTDQWAPQLARQLGEHAEPRTPGVTVYCPWAHRAPVGVRGYVVRVAIEVRSSDQATATFSQNCRSGSSTRPSGYTRAAILTLERLSEGAWVARLQGRIIS